MTKVIMGSMFYEFLKRHYHLMSFVANMLIAVSMAGMALLGVLTTTLTYQYLVGWGIFMAVLFGIGKTLDQEIDDMDKVREHTIEPDKVVKE